MTTPDPPPRRRVFLCHNRFDRDRVRDVAEALELEYGVPHFLDEYAIGAGDEYMDVIRQALESSSACAIFLGPHGWGPTHFTEAELALARYRRDPEFRLIPVLLRGAREDDMTRLGQGTVFRDFNRIDYASDDDATAVRKLADAVEGRRPEGVRGPARLTPYLIRRDAARWLQSGRRDSSLLYRGTELAEAERIAANSPDVAAAEQVLPFLTAAAQAQRTQFRRTIAVAIAIVLVIAIVAVYARWQQRLAESRQSAAEAQVTPFRDRGLLLTLKAERITPTVEARAAQLTLLDNMPKIDRFLHGHVAGVRSVAFSDDGRRVAAGAENGRILVWEWRVDRQPVIVQDTGAPVHSLRFARGDGLLIAGDAAGLLRIFDLATRRVITPAGWTVAAFDDRPAPVTALAIDGETVVAGDMAGRIMVVDLAARRVTDAVQTPLTEIRSVDLDPAGTRLAAGGEVGKFVMVDRATRAIVEPPPNSRSDITRVLLVRFLDEGRLLVTLNASGFLETWRTPGLAIAVDTRFPLRVDGIAADLQGRLESINDVVVSDASGAIHGFGVADGSRWTNGVLRAHRLFAPALHFSRDGHWLASGGVGGEVIVWNLRRRHPLITATATIDQIPDALAWKEKEVVVAWKNGNAQWQTAGGETIGAFAGEARWTTVSRNGNRFAAAFADGRVLVAESSRALFLPGRHDGVSVLRFDDNGKHLAVGTIAGKISIFDVAGAPALARTLREQGDHSIASLRFSHDGERLAVGDHGGWIELWSVGDGAAPARVHGHGGPVFALAFDPSNRTVVSGSGGADRGVRFWRVRDLTSLGDVAEQHTRAVSAIEYSADGKTMLSADDGGTIVLWEPRSRRIAGRITFPQDTVITSLAIDPDGRSFAVNADRDIHVVALSSEALRRVLCTIVNSGDAVCEEE